MKKLITILSLCLFVCTTAQVNVPRFGIKKNQDNTGRGLTYAEITTTDVASPSVIDTILLSLNSWETVVIPSANLVDSVVYKFSTTNTAMRVGDICTFMISKGSANGRVRFSGPVVIGTAVGTGVALAANKTMIIRFRWNGILQKWVEECRTVQP